MKHTSTLLLTLALLNPLLSSYGSDIYQKKDESGTHYSDKADEGSKIIQLKPTNTTPAIQPNYRTARKTKTLKKETIYQHFGISSPRNNSVIANGLYPINVKLSIKPALQKNHRIQLSINNIPHSSSQLLNRQIANLPRGKQSLQATIIDQNGKKLLETEHINLTVYRPSTKNRK